MASTSNWESLLLAAEPGRKPAAAGSGRGGRRRGDVALLRVPDLVQQQIHQLICSRPVSRKAEVSAERKYGGFGRVGQNAQHAPRLAFLVADVSTNGALIEAANFLPSAADTILGKGGDSERSQREAHQSGSTGEE